MKLNLKNKLNSTNTKKKSKHLQKLNDEKIETMRLLGGIKESMFSF